MRLFYDSNIKQNSVKHSLSVDESKHIVRVLRMKKGDKLAVLNGNGGFFECVITNSDPKECELEVVKETFSVIPEYEIHVAIAPTKQMERLEYFVEKATEIGITEISLIGCGNSERTKLNIERLTKKAVSAMKQSHRVFLPKINDIEDVKTFISNNPSGLLAHCYEDKLDLISNALKPKKCPISIGPEGDFTKEEIELALNNGYKSITLGENRLRTETAGLYACMQAKMIFDK